MHTKLISPDSQLRPRVAKNVWQYSDQKTWLAFLQITEDYPLDLSIHTAVRIKPQDIHGHYHPDTHHLVDYIQL